MEDKRAVMAKAARAVAKEEGVSMQKAKESVYWLMHILANPTKPERDLLTGTPFVRYISYEKEGCLGFCGEKNFKSGPPAIKDSQRMARFLSVGGGFGSGKPNIALLGVMYWSGNVVGDLHLNLSRYHKAPVIYLHQGETLRNRPKRAAAWGYHAGQFIK